MAPNSLQSQRQQLSLHHQPCGEVTSPLRHDDNKAMAAAALLRDETRQVSAPLYWQNPKDDAHQRPIPTTVVVGASPSVLPTNNYTVINSEECAADSNKSIKFKKRPIPPCPCPDDMTAYVKMNRKEGVNNRRRSEFNIDDDNLDVKDIKGYCRSIRSKLNEVFYRTPGPLQQNLRARLLAQQVWFELQCKLFLPTPVITKSTFIEVLQTFENIRDYSASKERSIWKQDMTATVGQGTGPPFSVFWGHAPRPRLCACPDTPCRCARTRAMPQDFSLPRGRAVKRVSSGPAYLPYVIERLQENVDLDRRFYIKVAEQGLMDCIRPEICLDECIPYFKVDKDREVQAYAERCQRELALLRDTCVQDCEGCEDINEELLIEQVEEYDELVADHTMEGGEECNAQCSLHVPARATPVAPVDARASNTAPKKMHKVLAKMLMYFRSQEKPRRRNILGGPKESKGVDADSLYSMESQRSSRSVSAKTPASAIVGV